MITEVPSIVGSIPSGGQWRTWASGTPRSRSQGGGWPALAHVTVLRCGPLTFPNYRLVPDSRWLLDLPARRVGARSARRRTRGVAMFVLGVKELKRYGFAAGASPSTNVPDPGFVPIARNRRFSAYAACG